MNVAFILLTAASFGSDPAPYASTPAPAPVYTVPNGEEYQPEKPGFFARLRAFFFGHKDAPVDAPQSCSCGASSTSHIAPTPPTAMPNSGYVATKPVYAGANGLNYQGPEAVRMPTGQPQNKVLATPSATSTSGSVEVDGKNPF